MSRLRRWLIWIHRYLGIPMSVVFVVWFVSGIVMMYAGGMPALQPEERLSRLQALDLDAVALTPSEAAAVAGFVGYVDSLKLEMVLGRPAYRFGGFRGPALTVFADNGEAIDGVTTEQARQAAAGFIGVSEDRVSFAGTVAAPDQWTLTLTRSLPVDRFTVDDGAGTWVYVAQDTGEVVLVTDRRTRTLAWLGTIPHWFYFTPLRLDQPLWYWTVVWTAALGCLLAALGLVLGVLQFRRTRPFSLSRSIPYRGWMRWHYYTGAVFGVFALTWVFSGMMSMEPFEWTNATGLELEGDVFGSRGIELDDYPPVTAASLGAVLDPAAIKEIEYTRILGAPYFLVQHPGRGQARERERLHQPYPVRLGMDRGYTLVDARTLQPQMAPFPTDSLLAHLRAAAHGADIAAHTLLTDYDNYYYSRAGQAPLPVLRVEFDDPDQTWYYVDPAQSRIVAQTHRLSRLERWLFNGLHSLDFRFWHNRRPLWDIGMIGLSIGALAVSLLGMWLGMKRLGRQVRPR